ncbi:hypothetical protein [Clostridium sp.]|uniref:hypothetical protein n=1 Tax=Clostridium sp. TaxID=1506 RepID=UPI002606DF4C
MDLMYKELIESIKFWIPFWIPIIVVYIQIKHNLKKRKLEIYREELKVVFDNLIEILERLIKIRELSENFEDDFIKETLDRLYVLVRKILLYGSKKTIKIISYMQDISYKNHKVNNKDDDFVIIILIVILICQLKRDITGEKINPKLIYKTLFINNNEIIQKYKKYNNNVVDKLKLENFFKIK